MRAVILNQFGDPEHLRLTDTPDPHPAPGQCLIAVEACDVLFLETMLRSGMAPPEMRPRLPWIPGNGVAGQILAVGEDVPKEWVGRLVGAHTGNRGGYAELAAVGVSDVVPIPAGVDARSAAALLHDGPTAIKLAQVTGISGEDTVLVLGASGGLGLALVQLARVRAGRVVAVARDAAKRERIAAFRPDALIDPEDPAWTTRASEALGARGASVLLDNVGPALGPAAFPLLAEGGHFSAHATHGGEFTTLPPEQLRERHARFTGIEQVQLPGNDMAALTEASFASAAAGELQPVIGQTFPLEQAAEAHRAIQARTVFGKTLLTTVESDLA
jgi:NADPH2:quinone reductase